ncbi:MAG: UDP-N-acetylmuramoyl-L-alanyl-D-glutamate--2,6-diaminopimelate ligase [Chthoniobacterales bacterium]
MRLSQLLINVPGAPGDFAKDPEISGLSYDSRHAKPGHIFFALPGTKTDGQRFIADAIKNGAVVIISQNQDGKGDAVFIQVPDAREAMAHAAANFYDNPSKKLKVIGVTGTNGKTTTAWLVSHLMKAGSQHCGLIGTITYDLGGRQIPAPRTTPEAPDLQEAMHEMLLSRCKACSIEISSHALAQKRSHAIEFTAAIFTNLTQDHLDYHGSMENYFEAKTKLFSQLATSGRKGAKAIINSDDRYGHFLLQSFDKKLKILRYGLGVGNDFRASNIQSNVLGTQYRLEAKGREYLVRLPLIGLFNVYNSLAALAAVSSAGVELRRAISALANIPQIPGRLERVPCKRDFQIFVDYAHTEDALENVLKSLRELKPRRLICVFGCGGDRDKFKRAHMGSVSEKFADFSILTTDNPRSEDPEKILADISEGMRGRHHEIIPDREKAIFRAVEIAEGKDIILIAGKGHELYQEIKGERHPFDDVRVATWALNDKPSSLPADEDEKPKFTEHDSHTPEENSLQNNT